MEKMEQGEDEQGDGTEQYEVKEGVGEGVGGSDGGKCGDAKNVDSNDAGALQVGGVGGGGNRNEDEHVEEVGGEEKDASDEGGRGTGYGGSQSPRNAT